MLIIFFIFTYWGPYNVETLFTFLFKALAEEASEDELPSDVDMNDPYFAEEVKKIGKPAWICDFFFFFSWNPKKRWYGLKTINGL